MERARNAGFLVLSVALVALTAGSRGVAQEPNMLTSEERSAGWTLLFDGTDLDGWAPRGEAEWQVADGIISPVPESGRGLLATTAHYDNFMLTVDFWIDETANSGVFIRCPAEGPISQGNSFEVNIYDPHDSWPTGSINEIAKIQTMPNTTGKWNTFEITADGDHLMVKLNGETTVDARSDRHTHGPIALQYNARGEVRFRNIKLKSLN